MKYTVLRVFTTFSLSKDEEICICVNYFNYRDIFIIMTFNKAETLRLVFLFLFSHFVPISKFQVLFITHPHYREQNAYQTKNQHTCSSSSGVWLCLNSCNKGSWNTSNVDDITLNTWQNELLWILQPFKGYRTDYSSM